MQTRKDFLASAGLLGTALLLSPTSSFAAGKKISNPGIQLYSVKDEMAADPQGTLKKLALMGYRQIESARSDKGHFYGLTAKEMKKACVDNGLTLRSGHVQIDANWDRTVAEAVESGQQYLICSSMPKNGQTADNYKAVAEKFNEAGRTCKAQGISFGYHNHDYEFESADGQVLYDILLQNTDPALVCMELDLGWVIATGNDPLRYFNKYPGRFPLWHLKDMDVKAKHSVELGKGTLAIKEIFKNAKTSGMKYFFVEQEEFANNPFESMSQNMQYLNNIRF